MWESIWIPQKRNDSGASFYFVAPEMVQAQQGGAFGATTDSYAEIAFGESPPIVVQHRVVQPGWLPT